MGHKAVRRPKDDNFGHRAFWTSARFLCFIVGLACAFHLLANFITAANVTSSAGDNLVENNGTLPKDTRFEQGKVEDVKSLVAGDAFFEMNYASSTSHQGNISKSMEQSKASLEHHRSHGHRSHNPAAYSPGDNTTTNCSLALRNTELARVSDILAVRKQIGPRTAPRRLIMGLTFSCEEWMLEIQLNELGSIVDTFIILETDLSDPNGSQCFPSILQSNPKVKMWEEKIVYIFSGQSVHDLKQWRAERLYREAIRNMSLSSPLSDDDLVARVLLEADEVLSKQWLQLLKHSDGFPTLIQVKLRWTYYGFHWVDVHKSLSVRRNIATSWGVLDSADINATNGLRANFFGRGSAAQWRVRAPVGWHCTWCLPTAHFPHKLRERVRPAQRSAKHKAPAWWNDDGFIERLRRDGRWFREHERDACRAERSDGRSYAPAYALEHPERFGVIAP